MKTILQLVAIAAVVFASGCATPYQSNSLTGGFSDTRLAPDVFRVTFRGNGYTSDERAQDFAMLRAAELSLQHGFTCFAIFDERHSSTPFSVSTPGTLIRPVQPTCLATPRLIMATRLTCRVRLTRSSSRRLVYCLGVFGRSRTAFSLSMRHFCGSLSSRSIASSDCG